MSRRVEWSEVARDEIEDLRDLATPGELRVLVEALRSIEFVLADDASSAGESRDGGLRILIVRPLAVTYEYDDDTVVLLNAWWCVP